MKALNALRRNRKVWLVSAGNSFLACLGMVAVRFGPVHALYQGFVIYLLLWLGAVWAVGVIDAEDMRADA